MALIVSAASGNFNAGATWVGGVVPTVGDEARASNGHTITITANAACDEVSNDGTGIFTLNDGVTLTANVTSKSTTTSRNCLQFTAASPASASIVGNITGGTVSGAVGVLHSSTGTLTITGNFLGGSASNAHALTISSTGTLNVTGNTTGGSGTAYGINGTGNSNISLTGNATGGIGTTAIGIIFSHSTASATITGNATGGTGGSALGAYLTSSGLITISGIATGGTGAAGAQNQASGRISVKRAVGNAFGPGNTAGLQGTPGVINIATGTIDVEELEFGQYGMTPTSGTGIRLKKVANNSITFNYADSFPGKTLIDATQGTMPSVTNVRRNVVYATGSLSGTCDIPPIGAVSLGVPVGNTTGTAVLTLGDASTAVWSTPVTSLTATGSIGARLRNASTVASTGQQLALTLTSPGT